MKAYICDICGKRHEPNQNDMPPNGWYTTTQYHRPDGSYNPAATRHVCSPLCLTRYAGQELGPNQEAEALEPPAIGPEIATPAVEHDAVSVQHVQTIEETGDAIL